MRHNLARLEDTPQFWVWFNGGHAGSPINMARDFYRFYSRPNVKRFSTWKEELIVYSYWVEQRRKIK